MKNLESKVESTTVESVVKQLGRPVNVNSVRQLKIQERLVKEAMGLLKRGRPIVGTSKRQEVIKKRADKVNSGIELKRGRPIDVTSKRQIELTKKAEKTTDIVELIKGQ